MTKPRKASRYLAVAGIVSAALLFPVTVTSGGGVPVLAPNDACASENCEFELGSLCELDGTMLTHYRAGSPGGDT